MNTDDFEGHTEGPWWAEEQDREGSSSMVWTIYGPDHWIVMESDGCLRIDWDKQDALLAAAAPNLLAEVKRLRKVLKNAHEFVVEEEGDLHDWHWSVINHLFDVRGEDCECSDCCEHETCPKCHACLEHYECQCEEEEE